MKDKVLKVKIVKSKCLADMFVWLGFEYTKVEEGYRFDRTMEFDLMWEKVHILKNVYGKK